jgi:hypothetical protein
MPGKFIDNTQIKNDDMSKHTHNTRFSITKSKIKRFIVLNSKIILYIILLALSLLFIWWTNSQVDQNFVNSLN